MFDPLTYWAYCVFYAKNNGLLNGNYDHDDAVVNRLKNNLVDVVSV